MSQNKPFRPNLLDEPEHANLLRMTKLVEHLFRVPIAYMALLGPDLSVINRIGSGREHWDSLKTYPLKNALAKSRIWPDPSGDAIGGFISGQVKFAAGAPLRTIDGLELGLLVIADVEPRAEFSSKDLETLEELATMLAGKMELRLMAHQTAEMASMLHEAESRFHSIANSAPVMIICAGVDGGSSFVNKIWLEFTGRSLAEELGEGFADSFHPDYRESVLAIYWNAFRDRKPLTAEFPMRRQDGEYRWVQARGLPRFLDNGSYLGYLMCFIDLDSEPPIRDSRNKLQVQAPIQNRPPVPISRPRAMRRIDKSAPAAPEVRPQRRHVRP
jgi:PAS domain S-box-containing protein